MLFSDSYYQEVRSTTYIHWHGDAGNTPPTFQAFPSFPTTISISGGTTIISQPSEHRNIPIFTTSGQAGNSEPQNSSRIPVKSNGLSKVSADVNTNGDAYTVTLLWNGEKPVSVKPRVSNGAFGIHAVGKKTTTPVYTVTQEKEVTDYLDRSFKLPSDADTSRYQFHYDSETGRVVAIFPKKPGKFTSLFGS